jgi:hypothetical protein
MSETPVSPPGLLPALLAEQGEATTLQKDKLNPAFRSKYLSLESLMEQVLPQLNRHGLVWITLPEHTDGEAVLEYKLVHAATGEKETGEMPLLLARKDPQGLGSAITYARRYALMAVLGLVADEDDDGNHASNRNASKPAARKATAKAAKPDGITPATRSAIVAAIKAADASEESIRLALTTAGGSSEGKASDAIKALTEKQGADLLALLTA